MNRSVWIIWFAIFIPGMPSWGQSGSVFVDDKEWLQPGDFGPYTYRQVAGVCPPPSGVCSGSLPNSTFDLTGYNWATVGEARELIDTYNVEPDPPKKFFGDFDPMGEDISQYFLYTLLRETPPKEGGYLGIVAGNKRGVIEDLDYQFVSVGPDQTGSGAPWFWRYPTQYTQKQFVFSIPESPQNPAQAECDEGIAYITKYQLYDIKPTYTGKFKISAISTWDKTSKVLDNDVNEVGEILMCQDWQTYWPERNLVPVYYEITIGNRKYRAVGAGTSPLFPESEVLPGGLQGMTPADYPEAGVAYLSVTATVLPATEGKVGGIFYAGNLAYLDGVDRAYYDHGGIGVLQLLILAHNSH